MNLTGSAEIAVSIRLSSESTRLFPVETMAVTIITSVAEDARWASSERFALLREITLHIWPH